MNQWRNQFVSVLGMAALVGVIGLFTMRSSHSAGGAVAVQVTNTPLLTSDSDNPARQPFGKRFDITFSNGAASQSFTVPAGKRLVITYVSTDAGVKPGANILLDLATTVNGNEIESHLPAINQGVILGQQVYASSDSMTVTADPGSTVTFAALDSDTSSGGLIIGIYGYLITP